MAGDPAGPLVAQVFKTRIDPFVQKLSFVRIFSGTLKRDTTIAVVGARKGVKIGPLLNAAIAYSNMNQNDKAEKSLLCALALDKTNAAAHFNLGLLRAEQRRLSEAEQSLRAALKTDPQMAAAAYNLGVLLGEKRLTIHRKPAGRVNPTRSRSIGKGDTTRVYGSQNNLFRLLYS